MLLDRTAPAPSKFGLTTLMRGRPMELIFPIAFVLVFGAAAVIQAFLPGAERSALIRRTSTNIWNLQHGQVDTFVASIFVTDTSLWNALPIDAVAAIAFFPLVVRFGNLRAIGLVAGAQVIGTLVSEMVLWIQILGGTRPGDLLFIDDVGPSYVIVAALVAVAIYGESKKWRFVAFVTLALWIPELVSGITSLDLTAVGHLVSILTAGLLGYPLSSSSFPGISGVCVGKFSAP